MSMIENDDIRHFIIFCLESYKTDMGITGSEALRDFEHYDLFHYLTEGFEVLHTQSREYIVNDIKDYIQVNK